MRGPRPLRFLPLTLAVLIVFGSFVPFSTARAFGGGGGGDTDAWPQEFKEMTAQWIGAIVHMAGTLGGFIDGANMGQYQLVMKQMEAQTLANYTPGENLCRLGTLSRALSASNDRAATTGIALQTMMLSRETHNNSRTRPHADADQLARLKNLAALYCNPGDNDRVPAACNCDLKAGTCSTTSGPIAPRSNRDLDLSRLFNTRLTMKINFTDDRLTPDEQDALGLLDNLSAYRPLPALSPDRMGVWTTPLAAKTFMDGRAIAATRGAVRATLSTQLGRRAQGEDSSAVFMLNVLEELGMTKDEAKRFLRSEGVSFTREGGDSSEVVAPSYEAQMEILTKKLYQNPNFYVNLVDKPANVDRTRAALLAIALMQRRDMKEILDRREMLLSQMLELGIRDEQKRMIKRLAQATTDGN